MEFFKSTTNNAKMQRLGVGTLPINKDSKCSKIRSLGAGSRGRSESGGLQWPVPDVFSGQAAGSGACDCSTEALIAFIVVPF